MCVPKGQGYRGTGCRSPRIQSSRGPSLQQFIESSRDPRSKGPGAQDSSILTVLGPTGSKGPRVQGFKGAGVQGRKGPEAQGFKGSRVAF